MTKSLPWPLETAAQTGPEQLRWFQAGSNICLDFHGDPVSAEMAVFSDGNHHMALEASLRAFRQQHPEVNDIFYATTPPGVLVNYLKAGQINLGNLTLSRLPDVFISPLNILAELAKNGYVDTPRQFMQSRGNVLLIRKDNPKNIQGIADLLRDDVRLFISNPHTEKASYVVYYDTIMRMTRRANLNAGLMKARLSDSACTCFGELIHHREAPQRIYEGRADVAMIYYHLALRYTRIFANEFDFIILDGEQHNPQPSEDNITTTYHIAKLRNSARYADEFIKFMQDSTVTDIYAEHGLQRPMTQ